MDFITHSLIGAGVAKLVSPKREWVPQLCAAALGGSLLQDADSWLYLIGPEYYGRYHRVGSHNLWALMLIALASATLAWGIVSFKPVRRFGWFVSSNLDAGQTVARVGWLWCLVVAVFAAYLHLGMDVITGFGNIQPFWPWSSWDASLHAVCSFDWVIFGATLGWHVTLRQMNWPRRRLIGVTAGYFVLLALYVAGRLAWCEGTVW